MGEAIPKLMTVVEIVKHRFFPLHQLNRISSREMVDEYLPLEEGLDALTFRFRVTVMEIRLGKTEIE